MSYKTVLCVGAVWLSGTGLAMANDLQGPIESVNAADASFVVQGIHLFTEPATDYDDGLKGFADLEQGLKVDVDFVYRDGKHFAAEIEKDD